jgi:hypothetical protein
MVTSFTGKDIRDISDSAICVGIILTGARDPIKVVQNMNLSFNMGKAQETTRNDWNDVIPKNTIDILESLTSSSPLKEILRKENDDLLIVDAGVDIRET